jgi:hypothetical protein
VEAAKSWRCSFSSGAVGGGNTDSGGKGRRGGYVRQDHDAPIRCMPNKDLYCIARPRCLLVDSDGLFKDHLTAQALPPRSGSFDASLVVGDHVARGAEHVCQAFRDFGIIIRSSE